ncbi:hypothetical protein NADFUDRAFT_82314 [Nadsonia fulvescens var. elongata DSM 6958]|uniref:Uncharacterized protein n=1 Tax=Nadsonia fulvescens var. elongata DSM 6958 TaxID=857566 RepID=A0A1E3PM64_9ASCO|nr:hypothetical protein NADFUDRAFT_82314 [Nadsonia fulvescens var. elongata DSM 6958]
MAGSYLDDALDLKLYDPTQHLNVLLANSSSLSQLTALKIMVSRYDNHLSHLVQDTVKHTPETQESLERVAKSTEELALLMDEIAGLRLRAQATETKITSMTAGIKQLDNTKANLILTITVLKRLQMLTTAYEQLLLQVKKRQYKEVAQTLDAVTELMSHFKPYRNISQIAVLSKSVYQAKSKLVDQIFEDYDRTVQGKKPQFSAESPAGLAAACSVIDTLGEDNRRKLITWYCNTQLNEYTSIFTSTDEAGSLENISRRYAYMKRILLRYQEEHAKFFDPAWKVGEELCRSFCNITRDDVKSVLAQSGKNVHVNLLLGALQETMEFEQYLEKKFSVKAKGVSDNSTFGSETPLQFGQAISAAFQPHLNLWIRYQDGQLSEKIAQFKVPPQPKADNNSVVNPNDSIPDPTVLPSSAELFVYYRRILVQTAKLSTGAPLLDLCNLFGKWLKIYGQEILKTTLPKSIQNQDDIKTTCLILNTADYCAATIGQLETKMIEQVDEEFKDKVNLDSDRNMYLGIVNQCINILVGKIAVDTEPSWREMTNTNWSKLENVGDQSSYVTQLNSSIEADSKLILSILAKSTYVRLFCDKVVDSVIAKFLLSVVACKPLSEIAAEQMLLDLYVLKSAFLKMPKFSPDINEAPSSNYSKHVNALLKKPETLLKVILTQISPHESLVQNYFYLIGDRSTENFIKILELKGITNKAEQRTFIELFKSHSKAHDNLSENSPILQNLEVLPKGANNIVSNHQSSSVGGLGLNLNTHKRSGSGGNTIFPGVASPAGIFESANLLTKEGFEKGLERFTSTKDGNKLNENIKNFGRFFRRDNNDSNE